MKDWMRFALALIVIAGLLWRTAPISHASGIASAAATVTVNGQTCGTCNVNNGATSGTFALNEGNGNPLQGQAFASVGNATSAATSTLTDGATVTWAIASTYEANAKLTFTTHGGSRTLNITNPLTNGQYVLVLVQDGTGGEGLTLGTGCTWKVSGAGAGAISPSTGANAIDILAFYYDGTNCYLNFNKNFT